MKLNIEIDFDSDAFCDETGAFAPGHELSRILREISDRIVDQVPVNVALRDINGNVCGSIKTTKALVVSPRNVI